MAFETFAVHAACIRGVEAIPVTVEVSLAGGVPGIQMLGIPSMEVMESRGRIRCAMRRVRDPTLGHYGQPGARRYSQDR